MVGGDKFFGLRVVPIAYARGALVGSTYFRQFQNPPTRNDQSFSQSHALDSLLRSSRHHWGEPTGGGSCQSTLKA